MSVSQVKHSNIQSIITFQTTIISTPVGVISFLDGGGACPFIIKK
jgi:hypothetical protein